MIVLEWTFKDSRKGSEIIVLEIFPSGGRSCALLFRAHDDNGDN